MSYFRVQHRAGPSDDWEGELVAHESTRTEDRTRWVDFSVYKLDDGGWLVHRAGMSSIYHRTATACRTASHRKPGHVTTVAALPDDAEPCDQCNPPYPEDLNDDEQIRYEFPRHTIDRVNTPAEVIEKLTAGRNRETGRRIVRVSEPVAALLDTLTSDYPEFAALTRLLHDDERGPLEQGEDDSERSDLPGAGPGRGTEDGQAAAHRRPA